jgi:hypothetical protein
MDDIKVEEWRDVVGYEGYYQVSNLGRIKSLKRIVERINGWRTVPEKFLSEHKDNSGYLFVGISKNGKSKSTKIHQLVAMAFLGHKPDGHKLVVNHKNFIKTDNRLENLEIVTGRENSNKKHLKSSSEYVGVHWDKKSNKWKSQINVLGKRKYLGLFNNEIDAHNAYRNALEKIEAGDYSSFEKRKTSSCYKGVTWDKNSKKWISQIYINGKRKYIGLFMNEIDAHEAYQDALKNSRQHHSIKQ